MLKKDPVIDHEPFRPIWWAPGAHAQTVVANFTAPEAVDCTRIEIETPDDDFLELDVIDTENSKPVAALFHGLEGSSERYYIRNLMKALEDEGFSSVALNFRGCGRRLNKQKRMYHSGETRDYATLFKWMDARFPNRQLYAVGFSLGANALVKSLGEEGPDHPVSRAVAVSPPYDLAEGSINMDRGFNKLYQRRFLKSLVEKADLKRSIYPDIPEFTGSSVWDFDDQITAPLHGFRDARDYYTQCSSAQFYEHVRKPLLVIHSKDDSLCPLKYAPHDVLSQSPFIETIFTDAGGHLGFLSSPRGWLNRTILRWLKA